jgi:hypothetical protein
MQAVPFTQLNVFDKLLIYSNMCLKNYLIAKNNRQYFFILIKKVINVEQYTKILYVKVSKNKNLDFLHLLIKNKLSF